MKKTYYLLIFGLFYALNSWASPDSLKFPEPEDSLLEAQVNATVNAFKIQKAINDKNDREGKSYLNNYIIFPEYDYIKSEEHNGGMVLWEEIPELDEVNKLLNEFNQGRYHRHYLIIASIYDYYYDIDYYDPSTKEYKEGGKNPLEGLSIDWKEVNEKYAQEGGYAQKLKDYKGLRKENPNKIDKEGFQILNYFAKQGTQVLKDVMVISKHELFVSAFAEKFGENIKESDIGSISIVLSFYDWHIHSEDEKDFIVFSNVFDYYKNIDLETNNHDWMTFTKAAIAYGFNEWMEEERENKEGNLFGRGEALLKLMELTLGHFDNQARVDDLEKFFFSYGRKELRRYLQANVYGPYGMDCNACAVMYFLQSYGLIPPSTTRKQFEYLFTPLVTKLYENISSEEADKLEKVRGIPITIDGATLWPKPKNQDLIDDIPFLRGYEAQGISPINGNSTKGTSLKVVCQKFYDYKDAKGNNPISEFRNDAACEELFKGINNVYPDLRKGLSASYFEKHVVFVGIYLPGDDKNRPGHYCVIVNEPRLYKDGFTYVDKQTNTSIEIEAEFWVYPADDPLAGKTEVFVLKEGESIGVDHYLFQEQMNISKPKRMLDDPYIRDEPYFRLNTATERMEQVGKIDLQRRLIVEGNAFGYKPTEVQGYYYK